MLDRASEKLDSARLLHDNGRYDDAVSRAFYSVFHAISAVLLARELVFSSHAQIIGAFNKEFIKTGIFPSDFSRKIQALFDLRQAGDYAFDPHIDRELSAEQITNAEIMISAIKMHLNLSDAD